MPAMLDDPTSPPIYRTSGHMPPDDPGHRNLHSSIQPRQVTLRDRTTIASLIPFSGPENVPPRLMRFLCDLLNSEIEKGDTYPMVDQLSLGGFGPYWFSNFAAVMILGEVGSVDKVRKLEAEGVEWKNLCLGSFYVKPNYPGRSSHVCNGGFLVSNASRNRGVGKLMGEGYLDWAPKLGYVYSVFNLVYETNHASIRIWDSLGFKRIGRVKGCGSLKSHPGTLVDAIIFGRDLGPESEDYVSEERFDKIRFYLKHQKYPVGADRAEKSRLRSAATHYHLVPGAVGEEEKLMLKDKEVIADTQKQYEIARQMHCQTHGGINKTTATIAEKYHWVRIKETVSLVIKNCPECKESSKVTSGYGPKIDGVVATSPGKSTSKAPPLPSTQASNTTGRDNSPPNSMAPPQVQPGPQLTSISNTQSQHQNSLLSSYDAPLHGSMSNTAPMSRTPSAPRQSPGSHEISTSAPNTIQLSTPAMLHGQQQMSPASLSQTQTLPEQMSTTLIPPHLNNLTNLNNAMGLTSANISPQGSAVHSPLPNGPASAPIGSIHDTFEMQIDPNLLAGIQNTSNYPALSSSGMDNAIQSIGNLDMDANMHGMPDLNPMDLGDPAMHSLSDHNSVSQAVQSGNLNLAHQLGQAHEVRAAQVLDQRTPQEADDLKPSLAEMSHNSMMMDTEMGTGR